MEIREVILDELDSRLERLKKHQGSDKHREDNEYADLNCALSRVIGSTLTSEIEDIKHFVEQL